MPKRFTDTEKWKKPFIRSLQAPYKLLFLYILDECNHAGIWNVEIEIAAMRIGIELSINDAREQLKKHIIEFDNGTKWFIPDFIDFQYGNLNPENRAHSSVIQILKKYNLYKNKPLSRSLQGRKDMDKDMDKDKVKDKDKESFDLARIKYPGTRRGLDTEFNEYKKKHKDWKECIELLMPAIETQIHFRNKLNTDGRFIPEWKHFKTWLNQRCWEDEINEQNYKKVYIVPKKPGQKPEHQYLGQ